MTAVPKADGAHGVGYDVATALWQGKRPYQEDTLLADFHGGMDRGFAVLADGMGGHAAGDLASRLVVIDAVSHLKFLMHDGAALEKNLHAELTSAIDTANDVLRDRAAEDPHLHGMGATFLATILFEDRLYWASVGDSPLYLWREGQLRQLNEDHSMAPVIDQMAKSGELTEEEAANHPDRNALTSVLMGGKLKARDVPKAAMVLDPGDVLIQASDGLQYIDNAQISGILGNVAEGASSRVIADALMGALHDLDDPAQDNTAVLVLQLSPRAGGVARSVMSTKAAAADGARAVEGGASAGQSAGTVKTPTPAPDGSASAASGLRRFLVPAVLVGGAALAVTLMFGLTGGKGTSEPDVAQTEAETPIGAAADTAIAGEAEVAVPTAPVPVAPEAAAATGGADATPAGAVEPGDGLSTSVEEDAVSVADETPTDATPTDDRASGAAPSERTVNPGNAGAIATKAGARNQGVDQKNFVELQNAAGRSSTITSRGDP